MRPAPADPAGRPADTSRVLNGPNLLTIARLACVPILAVLMASGPGLPRAAAAAVFVVASLTDLLDGAWARRSGQVTTFGKVADPIADKALIAVALIGLSMLGQLPWWVTLVILGREIGVTALRFWVIEHGVIPASRGGKAKTAAQTVAVTMLLADLPLPWWPAACAIAVGIALVLTVVTGIDYVVRAVRLRRKALHG